MSSDNLQRIYELDFDGLFSKIYHFCAAFDEEGVIADYISSEQLSTDKLEWDSTVFFNQLTDSKDTALWLGLSWDLMKLFVSELEKKQVELELEEKQVEPIAPAPPSFRDVFLSRSIITLAPLSLLRVIIVLLGHSHKDVKKKVLGLLCRTIEAEVKEEEYDKIYDRYHSLSSSCVSSEEMCLEIYKLVYNCTSEPFLTSSALSASEVLVKEFLSDPLLLMPYLSSVSEQFKSSSPDNCLLYFRTACAMTLIIGEKAFTEWAELSIQTMDNGDTIKKNIFLFSLVDRLLDYYWEWFVPYFKYLKQNLVMGLNLSNEAGLLSCNEWYLKGQILQCLQKCFHHDRGRLEFLDAQHFQLLYSPIIMQFVAKPPIGLETFSRGPPIKEMDRWVIDCLCTMIDTSRSKKDTGKGYYLLWIGTTHLVFNLLRKAEGRTRSLGLRFLSDLIYRLDIDFAVLGAQTMKSLKEIYPVSVFSKYDDEIKDLLVDIETRLLNVDDEYKNHEMKAVDAWSRMLSGFKVDSSKFHELAYVGDFCEGKEA